MVEERRWVVAVHNLGGTHKRGQEVRPEEFPGKGQWERLAEIGAVRPETAAERAQREEAELLGGEAEG